MTDFRSPDSPEGGPTHDAPGLPRQDLHQAVAEYLALRRALGFRLERAEQLLGQFVDYLHDQHTDTVTIEHALAWVMVPGASINWLSQRLSTVRCFAAYLHSRDGRAQIPPARMLPSGSRRPTPYLYSPADITTLITACARLRGALRIATHQTLIGLLAVTGMRIGEAIRLDDGDIDLDGHLLTVRQSKGSTRLIPLHPTTTDALVNYRELRERLSPNTPVRSAQAFFISNAGTRLLHGAVERTFRTLTIHAGLSARPSGHPPRLHDLRHSLAVTILCEWLATGTDIDARIPLLSTWLGHTDPSDTYYYLTASPELMALAVQRLPASCRDSAAFPSPDHTKDGQR